LIEGAKAVSALNIGSKYRLKKIDIGVSAYRLRLMKKYRYRIGPKKSVSVNPYWTLTVGPGRGYGKGVWLEDAFR
jgi:hypothetical protein